MSRVEENNNLSIPHHISSNNEVAMIQIETTKMKILLDISRSLAEIADKMEPGATYKLAALLDHYSEGNVPCHTEEDNDGK